MRTITRPPMTIASRIESAVCAIINARQFCGDEGEAITGIEDDHGRFTADERREVKRQAEARWSEDQRAAGVTNPISPDERIRINAALEDDGDRDGDGSLFGRPGSRH